ncbi:hypothetical protein QQF64_014206 [Cirrhinus molitorella]|uniref:Uncharacterized protein n=1 Tax=Cirrhinus molitorella TaxID=172907 RepID=A0ABR3LTC0_9TELE
MDTKKCSPPHFPERSCMIYSCAQGTRGTEKAIKSAIRNQKATYRFHMNAHSNLCSSPKAPRPEPNGCVHQKTGGEHGKQRDGAPKKHCAG